MKFQKAFSLLLLPVAGSYAQTLPVTVTATGAIATPTASPLPPVNPIVEAFIGELSTAILYASLIGNGNLPGLCALINPPALSNIPGINGEIVQREVCGGATVVALNATLAEILVQENQNPGVSVLATALFAVQVAGNYAGGTNLDTLCSEIEEQLITNLFFNYIDNFGTTVKNYICNAAKNTTLSPTLTPTPSSSPTYSNTTETCALPTGFGNKVVRVPDSLADAHFYPDVNNFNATHALFGITDLNIDLPESVFTSFCLDKCIAFSSPNRPCRSIFVNQGKPFPLRDSDPPPPPGSDTAPRWYCSGFDVPLTAAVYRIIDAPESYLYGLGVNRVRGSTYRAY